MAFLLPPTVGMHVMGMEPNGIYDWGNLLQWTALAKPSVQLMCNNLPRAAEVYHQMPAGSKMIHRVKEANDARLNLVYTPQQYVNTLPRDTPFYHQVGNEPDGYTDVFDYAKWLLQIIDIASPLGLKLALPAFGMGNPDDVLMRSSFFDELMWAILHYGHMLIQHEYFVFNAPTEPYHVGRIFGWVNRYRALGWDLPLMAVSEAGTDIGGGFNDGWRGKGWTAEYYFDRLREQAMIYRPYGIPMIVYCYGIGFDWRSFDVQDESYILSSLLEYNLEVRGEDGGDNVTDLPAGTTVKHGTLTKMPSAYVNVRNMPQVAGSSVVSTLPLGSKVDFAEPIQYIGWYWVKTASNIEGWVSKQIDATTGVHGVVITPDPDPEPEPEPQPTPQFTKAELLALKAHSTAIAEAETAIAAIYGAAASRMP